MSALNRRLRGASIPAAPADEPPTPPWTARPDKPASTRPPGLDRLLGHVAGRLTAPADPTMANQVTVVVTLDGEPKVFSASATALTNVTSRDALRSLLRATFRAAIAALDSSGPWLQPTPPSAPDVHAAYERGYAAFLDEVRSAGRLTGISRDQVLDRLYERSDIDQLLEPVPSDVDDWLRQGLRAGDITAAADSALDDTGLPLFVRLADDMAADRPAPDAVADVAADDNNYQAFLTVVYDADPRTGVRTREILNRLNKTFPYKDRLTGQATIPDVIRWVRHGLGVGDIDAIPPSIDSDGLPLFVRRHPTDDTAVDGR